MKPARWPTMRIRTGAYLPLQGICKERTKGDVAEKGTSLPGTRGNRSGPTDQSPPRLILSLVTPRVMAGMQVLTSRLCTQPSVSRETSERLPNRRTSVRLSPPSEKECVYNGSVQRYPFPPSINLGAITSSVKPCDEPGATERSQAPMLRFRPPRNDSKMARWLNSHWWHSRPATRATIGCKRRFT